MNYTIVLTEQTKADLIDIYRYISTELKSPQNAEKQLSRIEKEIASLEQMPYRYRLYDSDKWSERNLRIMPVDNYLVLYIPSKDKGIVTIVRIMYGGRDISLQLQKSL